MCEWFLRRISSTRTLVCSVSLKQEWRKCFCWQRTSKFRSLMSTAMSGSSTHLYSNFQEFISSKSMPSIYSRPFQGLEIPLLLQFSPYQDKTLGSYFQQYQFCGCRIQVFLSGNIQNFRSFIQCSSK